MCAEDACTVRLLRHCTADAAECPLHCIVGTGHRGRQEGGHARTRLECGNFPECIRILVHRIRAVRTVDVDVHEAGRNVRACRVDHLIDIRRAELRCGDDARDLLIVAEDVLRLCREPSALVR